MKRNILFVLFAVTAGFGCSVNKGVADANVPANAVNSQPKAVAEQKTPATPTDSNEVDMILTRLDRKSREIKTYEAKIVYLIQQPVLESEILREGMLYYANDEKGSMLRINFTSSRQDNELEPNSREEYLFDSVNLMRVNYKLKNVEYRQLTDANRPLNAFDLASQYLPIVGFTKADKLKDDFEISYCATKEYDELLLKTKPQSHYKNDYVHIRFWIDKSLSLPARVEATSPQEDISVIRFGEAKVNKGLPTDIFKIEVPSDFDKNIVPFEKEKH
jgi:outer membrane lipoprotein-sorting protein